MTGASGKWSASRLATSFAVVLAHVAMGCGADPGFPPPPNGAGGGITSGSGTPATSGTGVTDGPCSKELSTLACHITLGTHDGITNCFEGVQTCINGQWGPCSEGKITRRRPRNKADGDITIEEIPVDVTIDDLVAGNYPKALSATITSCADKCDPTCTLVNEQTPVGGTATPSATIDTWVKAPSSTLQTYAPTIGGRGNKQPCGGAWDCEFNQYCSNPVTSPVGPGQCAHDKCGVGDALDPTTCSDACVQAVCNNSGNCCTQCEHPPCAVGGPLTCPDVCVQNVCAPAASGGQGLGTCCTGTWDATCVAAYASCRGPTFACPMNQTTAWDSSCIRAVHDFCGVNCTNSTPNCIHDKCTTGGPLTTTCDSCAAAVCANPATAYCCAPGSSWDAACVAAVPTYCGKACTPASATGVCQSWVPNQIDQQCAGPDLTATAACYAVIPPLPVGSTLGNKPVVPICNVGTSPTPPLVPVVINVYAGGTSGMPTYPPNTAATLKGTCSTATLNAANPPQIQPGRCVDVPCPAPTDTWTMAQGDEILVNPPGATQTAECNLLNNWSMKADPGNANTCDKPICSPRNSLVYTRAIHTYFEIDRSSPLPNSLLGFIQQGFSQYFNNATEQGVQSSIQVAAFPGTNCDAVANCGNYGACSSGMALTPFNAGTAASFVSFTSGLTRANPTALAPYSTALTGALNAATNDYQNAVATNPNAPGAWPFTNVVLVLGTDPTVNHACTWNVASLAGMAANAFTANGIRTSVIALGSALKSTAQTIAAAGGGKAYYHANIDVALPASIQADLVDIRSSTYPCSFPLPPLAQFDPTNPLVINAPPVGAPKVATLVTTCGAGRGFTYDNPASPTMIQLCPTTCAEFGGSLGSSTQYRLACPGFYAPTPLPGTNYQGVCPVEGTKVEWRFFTYDTNLPDMTTVQFSLQTGAMPMPKNLPLVDGSSNGPPVCSIAGPAGVCPIDLVTFLDGNSPNGPAFSDTMAVGATLGTNPTGTAAASINSWQLRYSCPFVQ